MSPALATLTKVHKKKKKIVCIQYTLTLQLIFSCTFGRTTLLTIELPKKTTHFPPQGLYIGELGYVAVQLITTTATNTEAIITACKNTPKSPKNVLILTCEENFRYPNCCCGFENHPISYKLTYIHTVLFMFIH